MQKSTSSDPCPQNSSTEVTLKEVTSNNAQISQLLRRLKEDALNVECHNGCSDIQIQSACYSLRQFIRFYGYFFAALLKLIHIQIMVSVVRLKL